MKWATTFTLLLCVQAVVGHQEVKVVDCSGYVENAKMETALMKRTVRKFKREMRSSLKSQKREIRKNRKALWASCESEYDEAMKMYDIQSTEMRIFCRNNGEDPSPRIGRVLIDELDPEKCTALLKEINQGKKAANMRFQRMKRAITKRTTKLLVKAERKATKELSKLEKSIQRRINRLNRRKEKWAKAKSNGFLMKNGKEKAICLSQCDTWRNSISKMNKQMQKMERNISRRIEKDNVRQALEAAEGNEARKSQKKLASKISKLRERLARKEKDAADLSESFNTYCQQT